MYELSFETLGLSDFQSPLWRSVSCCRRHVKLLYAEYNNEKTGKRLLECDAETTPQRPSISRSHARTWSVQWESHGSENFLVHYNEVLRLTIQTMSY